MTDTNRPDWIVCARKLVNFHRQKFDHKSPGEYREAGRFTFIMGMIYLLEREDRPREFAQAMLDAELPTAWSPDDLRPTGTSVEETWTPDHERAWQTLVRLVGNT